jgi:hypothetical protein
MSSSVMLACKVRGYTFYRAIRPKRSIPEWAYHVNELRGGLTLPAGAAHLPLLLNALGDRVTPPRGCMGVPLLV